MRFRKLTLEELAPLEQEFKQFLIVNNIHDAEWRQLNAEEPDKVNSLIEVFSEAVLLKVYGKISYLEFYRKDNYSLFEINATEIKSFHILPCNNEFELPENLHDVFSFPKRYSIKKGKKKIMKCKEEEVHDLLKKGCTPSTEYQWRLWESSFKEI